MQSATLVSTLCVIVHAEQYLSICVRWFCGNSKYIKQILTSIAFVYIVFNSAIFFKQITCRYLHSQCCTKIKISSNIQQTLKKTEPYSPHRWPWSNSVTRSVVSGKERHPPPPLFLSFCRHLSYAVTRSFLFSILN